MSATAFNMGAGEKLKLTETLKEANSYAWGGTSVTTSAKHKYVLGVINYQQRNNDTRNQGVSVSFSAGEEVLSNQSLESGSTTEMARISLFRNVPAGTKISFERSWAYANTQYLQVYCFD